MTAPHALDLYSIGEMVVDFLPGGEPGSYVRSPGGAPANLAIAAARCGLAAGFCGKLGDDGFGRFLLGTLEKAGVRPLCQALTAEAVTTMAFVTLGESGERSFTFARKPGADMLLSPAEVKKEEVLASRIVHAGSCSLSRGPAAEATVKALRLGHEGGRLVSFDINYRALLWDGDLDAATRAVHAVLPWVDLLKLSEEEVGMVGGEGEIPALMARYGIALVAETLGGKGARCYFGGRTFNAPCPPVPRVDTTGAGDAFLGAFLAALARAGAAGADKLGEEAICAALRAGNVAGTLCVQKKGAVSSLPTWAEIEAELGKGGYG